MTGMPCSEPRPQAMTGATPGPVPARMPTVFHLRSSGGIFGADRVVLDLCTELGATGYRAVLVPLLESDGSGQALRHAGAELGVPVRPLVLASRFDLSRAAAHLRRLATIEGAVILHGHDYKSNALIALARVAATPRVATLHGRVGTDWKLRLYESLETRLVRRFDRVICVSEPMRAAEARRGLRPLLISNGIDVHRFADQRPPPPSLRAELGLDSDSVIVGSIGRLSKEKGLDTLIHAVARLFPRHSELQVLLVGEGSERAPLADLARRLGIAERVRFAGLRTDTPALYQLLDVFCMPSWREGLPLALLEALAAGRAALVTPVGGVGDIIRAGEERGTPPVLTFMPRDVEGMVDGLERLLSDPELRRQLAAAGQALVAACFSRRAMAQATAAVYDELRGDRALPTPT